MQGKESVKNYVDRVQAGLRQRVACAAREALRRRADGRARASKLRGRARLRRKNANSSDKSMQKSVAGLGILW